DGSGLNRGALMAFPPHILPAETSLSGRVPEQAPPGSIFVIGDQQGWAVPPRRFTLHFGRDEEEVHVPLGVDDPDISRQHGVFLGDGTRWWLENRGRLPIQMPDRSLLLRGHGCELASGYTPLIIAQRDRKHVLHVRLVGHGHDSAVRSPKAGT